MKRNVCSQLRKPRLLARSVNLMSAAIMSFFLVNVCHANPYGGGTFETFGVGTNSCGKYTSHFSDPDWKSLYSGWIGGYITGINYSNSEINDISGGLDKTALLKWVYNYCNENPLEDVVTAAHKLVQYLYNSGKYRKSHDDQ